MSTEREGETLCDVLLLASSTSVVDAILVWFDLLKCNHTKMTGIMIRTAWTIVIYNNIASKIQIAKIQR